MSTTRKAAIGAAVGILLGAGFVAVWWWAWGCRVCAPGSSPWAFVAFGVAGGAALGAWLGAVQPTPQS
jgi:hypothetical protein